MPVYEGIEYSEENIPKHAAIIMDGNGRWAKREKKAREEGHRAGAQNVLRIVQAASDIGLNMLTLYAFSTENWKRSKGEVSFLMRLLEEFFKKEVRKMTDNGVRIRQIGDINGLPKNVKKIVENAENVSRENTRFYINVALNYGGRDEIVRACRKVAAKCLSEGRDPNDIDERSLAAELDTFECEDPDIVIRSSGEMRISNFLLFQSAYSEYWTTETLWPDFSGRDLAMAVADFQKRKRRFGARP